MFEPIKDSKANPSHEALSERIRASLSVAAAYTQRHPLIHLSSKEKK